MKKTEIAKAVRRFRRAIEAWEALERELAEARRRVADAAPHHPALAARAHQLFGRVALRLEVIGAAVADVPGLAEEVEEGQERLAQLRKLAERHGVPVRYDGG